MGALSREELIAFAVKHAGEFCTGSDGDDIFSGRIVGYCEQNGHLILEHPGWAPLDQEKDSVCLIPGAYQGWYVFEDLKLKQLTEDERKLLKQLTEDIVGWEP